VKFLIKLLHASILLCLCTTVGLAQSALTPPPKRDYKYDGKIVSTYDKSKDQTIVLIQLMPVKDVEDPRDILDDTPSKPRREDYLHLTMFFAYPGVQLATPQNVSIGFTYMAFEPQMYGDHLLTAKIDGQRITLGKMQVLRTQEVIVRNAYKRYTRRALELVIPYEQLLRIANAKKVKMKIGDFEFSLSRDHLEAVRDLASRTVP
jgi:hypothetical protein